MNDELILDQNEGAAGIYAKITKEEYQAFIGKQADYFLPKWEKFSNKKITSFNIYTFFFGFFWMLYRKMYSAFFIVLGILTAEGLLEGGISAIFSIPEKTMDGINRLMMIVFGVLSGMLGDWLYFKEAKAKISRIKSLDLDQEEYYNQLRKKGGTSPYFLLFLLIGVALLIAYLYQENN
jgi:hypothetical protein